ncbi:AbrB/MazE/SpoVT family DNA-binding domain-containing protein [Brucella endophytica]
MKRVTVPKARPRYSLAELLAQYDPSVPLSAEEREWIDTPPVGRELI